MRKAAEPRGKRRLLPVALAVAILVPSDPFATRAAAAILGPGERGPGAVNRPTSPVSMAHDSAVRVDPVKITALGSPITQALSGPALVEAETVSALSRSEIPTLAAAASDVEAAPGGASAEANAGAMAFLPGAFARFRRLFAPKTKKQGAPEPLLEEAFDGALPAEEVRAFLIRPGRAPVGANLAGLNDLLSEPGLAQKLNRLGHMTYVVGDKNPGRNLSRADGEAVVRALAGSGVAFGPGRTRIETLSVDWKKNSGQTEPEGTKSGPALLRGAVALGVGALGLSLFGTGAWYQAGLAAFFVSNADRLARETAYCVRILKTSFKDSKTPLPSEIVGALVTKVPAFGMNLVANLSVYLPAAGLFILGGVLHARAAPVILATSAAAAVVGLGVALRSGAGGSRAAFALARGAAVGAFAAALVMYGVHTHGIPEMAAHIVPGPAHWTAFALATAWSLCLETFHGAWVRTWDTFQNRIGKQRGAGYQSLFGFAYMQITGGVFRTISYLTLPNIFPMWDIRYLQSISAMTIIGTLCGVSGFRGLNALYDKGRISAKTRSGIQQIRDLCWLAIGPFFNSGNMLMTVILFSLQQSVDLALYAFNAVDDALSRYQPRGRFLNFIVHQVLRHETRPVLVFTDARVAATKELALGYPVDANVVRPSPWKEAADQLKGFALVRAVLAPLRLIRNCLR